MKQLLNYKDCEDLSNTICQSFYYEKLNQGNYFEVWRNKKVPNDLNSVMYFYDNLQSALISYNVFKNKYKCSLVWREYNYTIGKSKKLNWSEDWIVIVNNKKKFKEFN